MSKLNVLVIGSTGGIGTPLAEMLRSEHDVICHYHKRALKEGDYYADITKFEEVSAMVDRILQHHKSIDAVVVASGISKDDFCHKFNPDTWAEVIDVNLIGAFNVIRAVLPQMRENQFGRIVMLSSVVFQNPVVGTSAYSASKSGLVGLTRTVALENATKGITCNCIALGYFDAGLLHSIPAELRERLRQSIPVKRFGRVGEIYDLIAYLMNAEYVTGQLIGINGGVCMI